MFEWDEAKRKKNIEKHSLDFRDSRLIFHGRPVVHVPSCKRDEARFASVAMIGAKLYTVVGLGEAVAGGSFHSGGHEMARKKHMEIHG